ncbi:S-layer protein domain-containing protein [Methanomethylovorans sp. PtaU1.Bin093]|uniref:S-layer protein domain-containing protein n=1 Tax=Methanomethylovorans sp. PtaU1.Bin093 TaxID=1811679 RepID=UPI0025D3B793|nr:S-layer protein domain-containing protein [Methanomethylovorans sp. PtaU1.Bin093]
MGYIRFVFICAMIILFLFSFPVYCSTEEKAMIYYSEETLTAGDTVHLEQGYSFKLIDASKDSGDILVQVYYKDEEIEIGDSFGDEDDPFEYMITIEESDEDEEAETDYVVIRIRPVDFDDKDDGVHVEVEIEQFLDPEQKDDDFLLLDTSKSVKVGESLSLEEGYTLDASDMEDDSVVLELSKDGRSLKKEELEIDDIFSYSKSVDDNVRTIFIARVSKFFESSDSSTVILKDVTQRPDMEEDDEEISENGSDNKINETQPLMAIPDIIDSDKEGLNSSATEDVQNFPSSSVNNENGTMTDHVNTDSFMPILFIVIIAIGIVIFKLS